jgi:hypothetical protein
MPATTTFARARQAVSVTAIVLLFGCLSYRPDLGCWVSLAGSLLILAFAKLAWPRDWVTRAGLRIRWREAVVSGLLFLAGLTVSYVLVHRAANASGIEFVPMVERSDIGYLFVHTVGQTLNEEIVLGALLLTALSRWCGNRRLILVSVGVALVFALLHSAFYAFRVESDPNYGWLTVTALVAVFGVGVLRNNLILASRHIGYAWAIHLGWNVVCFHSRFTVPDRAVPSLNEPERFNLLLGYPVTVIVVTAAAAVSVVAFRRRLFR